MKNGTSRKPKSFEQAYFDARFAISEFSLTARQYGIEKFNSVTLFFF